MRSHRGCGNTDYTCFTLPSHLADLLQLRCIGTTRAQPMSSKILTSCVTAALTVLAAALCGAGGSPRSVSAGTAITRFDETITVDGRERAYTLVLPANYDAAQAVPLILALHGGGGNSRQFENSSLLTPKASAAGFAVVYPNGTADGVLGLPTWNGGNCCGSAVSANVDDVNFIRQMISSVRSRYKIDPRRVYATGHSNGAIMSYRLACDLSDRIAAIAPNAGLHEAPVCSPGRPVPILHMHSKLDTNVPYLGGPGSGISGVTFPPLADVMTRWVNLNGCAPTPSFETVAASYTRALWSPCNSGATVGYILTEDGGHSWPGGEAGRPGGDPPSAVINANDELLAFFGRHSLPAVRTLWLPAVVRG